MEKERQDKAITIIFTILMRTAVAPAFAFPKGGVARRAVRSCLEILESYYGEISNERIVDFCICQVHAVSRFDQAYLRRWKVIHSFGRKALERFTGNKRIHRYYEDRWLQQHGLSRETLSSLIRDRREHPLFRYIFPEYEEVTKRRALSTAVGYYICGVSTLLWSPFSPACQKCRNADICNKRTQMNYPELYRIRMEEYNPRR